MRILTALTLCALPALLVACDDTNPSSTAPGATQASRPASAAPSAATGSSASAGDSATSPTGQETTASGASATAGKSQSPSTSGTATNKSASPTATASSSASPTEAKTVSKRSSECSKSKVNVDAAYTDGGMSKRWYSVTLTNASASECFVHGAPRVEAVDASGKVLGTSTRDGDLGEEVVLAPGQKAVARWRLTEPGVVQDCRKVSPSAFRVHVPDYVDESMPLTMKADICAGNAGSVQAWQRA